MEVVTLNFIAPCCYERHICISNVQILTQDTDSPLSMRVFWQRGEDWRSILDPEVTREGTCAPGLHEVLFQMDQALSHRPLVSILGVSMSLRNKFCCHLRHILTFKYQHLSPNAPTSWQNIKLYYITKSPCYPTCWIWTANALNVQNLRVPEASGVRTKHFHECNQQVHDLKDVYILIVINMSFIREEEFIVANGIRWSWVGEGILNYSDGPNVITRILRCDRRRETSISEQDITAEAETTEH